jgi:hypothetical protein
VEKVTLNNINVMMSVAIEPVVIMVSVVMLYVVAPAKLIIIVQESFIRFVPSVTTFDGSQQSRIVRQPGKEWSRM